MTAIRNGELLVEVKGVYKKFCKSLRMNMWYGFIDMFSSDGDNVLPKLRKDEFWALQDMNIKLHRGEVIGLVGLNGAGKTSLIRLLIGTYPVTCGNISINGKITTIFEKSRAFEKFYSGVENIRVKCALFGMRKKEINKKLDEILDFAEIRDFAHSPFGTYSAGMRARVNFAIAIVANPDILIIDEGLAVGDVKFRQKCLKKVAEMSKNCGVIMISHNMEQFENLADRMIIMQKGRIAENTADIKRAIQIVVDKKNEE